eukprot:COSAG01_NODE_4584_length_4898_cov_18.985622_7_plen_57_part_00
MSMAQTHGTKLGSRDDLLTRPRGGVAAISPTEVQMHLWSEDADSQSHEPGIIVRRQ